MVLVEENTMIVVRAHWRLLVLVVALCTAALGQVPVQPRGGNSIASLDRPSLPHGTSDPAPGTRWLLERDPARPAGPGRWVRVLGSLPSAAGGRQAAARPMVKAGDALIVVEESSHLSARYEAVALAAASAGATLPARLGLNGRLVHAVLVGPGLARLAPAGGGWQ